MGVSTENWVSLRAFSRERGVSLAAVQKAIATGRVTAIKRTEAGRIEAIDAIAAMEQWNKNTDLDQAGRAGAPLLVQANTPPANGAAKAVPAAESQSKAPDEVGGDRAVEPTAAAQDDQRYLAARAVKQEFEAKQAELDYLEALGKVVSTAELQRVSARRYAMVRDKLLNIPDRTATLLAAERDPARVHAQLTAEIKRVLNELADAAESETAGGTVERVAA